MKPESRAPVFFFFLPSYNIFVEGLVGVVDKKKNGNPVYFEAVRGWELFVCSIYKGLCTLIHQKSSL